MKQLYKLISMTLILSTNAFATIPLAIPPYVTLENLENLVNTQKQAHSRCLDEANNKKEKKDCHIMLEEIKAITPVNTTGESPCLNDAKIAKKSHCQVTSQENPSRNVNIANLSI